MAKRRSSNPHGRAKRRKLASDRRGQRQQQALEVQEALALEVQEIEVNQQAPNERSGQQPVSASNPDGRVQRHKSAANRRARHLQQAVEVQDAQVVKFRHLMNVPTSKRWLLLIQMAERGGAN